MTVLEAIQKSAEFLARKGVDSPRLQSELLLAHALQLARMKLYLNFERGLTEAETNALREMVRRRGLREPLQHIVGSTSFCGLEIAVNHHVLVPRPETELLAEAGWKFLASLDHASPAALDFGTGSGCLAIVLAVKTPVARVCATDLSRDALAVAQRNAGRHGVAERIQWLEGAGFAALPPDTRFDLIVSNPPYIPSAEIETLAPEVRDFDPRLALDGGVDGMAIFRLIAAEAGRFLRSGGRLLLEFGDGQAEPLREILEGQKWIVEAVTDDYSQRPRILAARCPA